MSNTSRAAMGLVGLAVLVTGCASRNSVAQSAAPPKLQLASSQVDTARAAGAAQLAPGSGQADGPSYPGFGGYVLTGTLPDKPTHAPVWRWAAGVANQQDVVKLGKAVGVDGTPKRHAYGWLLSSPVGEVRVSDAGGHPWAFTRADLVTCSPYMIDIDRAPDGSASGCGTATSSDQTPKPGPDAAAARAAVAPLIDALGIKGDVQVNPGAPASSVLVSTEVGGLPTQGLETSIDLDSSGVRSAYGRLAAPAKGAEYPLRTAQQAFKDLVNQPRIMIAMPYCGPMGIDSPGTPLPPDASGGAKLVPGPGGSTNAGGTPASGAPAGGVASAPSAPIATASPAAGPNSGAPASDHPYAPPIASCPTPKPQQVTGATIGLQLTSEGSGQGADVLVPSWFFTIQGSTTSSSVIAIDQAFLAPPDLGSPQPGSTSTGSTGGGSAEPGSIGSPVLVPPQPASYPTAKPSS